MSGELASGGAKRTGERRVRVNVNADHNSALPAAFTFALTFTS